MCKSQEREGVSLSAFMTVQISIMFSPLNVWYAGEYFNHQPSNREIVEYWVLCGAAAWFRNVYWEEYLRSNCGA